jgi:tripartite-type tricarboxylate transporter receptor subunit TctC
LFQANIAIHAPSTVGLKENVRLVPGIQHAIAIAAAFTLATPAVAQSWPARPVRIIVPYAPGGGIDIVARQLAQKLTEQAGGTFLVENRPGGAGVLGAELVARAAPDGHTLLASSTEFAINPAVRAKLPYDPLRDFAHISQLASVQFILAGHPSVPVRNVKELVSLARARPGELTYGSSGAGGGPHLAGELLQSMAGIRWLHVPFKGAAPASIAVISGEIDFAFGATIGLLENVRAGKLRAIAVTGLKRFAGLPEVPTAAESGIPGYSATGWYGFYAPGGTSPELVRRLYNEAVRGLGAADVRERLEKSGNEYVMSPPAEFGDFLRGEIAKWTKLVKEANLRIE